MLPYIVLDSGFRPSSSQLCSKRVMQNPWKAQPSLPDPIGFLWQPWFKMEWIPSYWHYEKSPLKMRFFILFSKVPNLPFLPQKEPLQSLAPGDKSDVRMSACKSWVFMLQNKYPAESKSSQSWSFSLTGLQCHNIVPTYRHKASVFSQAQIPGHGLWSDKAPAL